MEITINTICPECKRDIRIFCKTGSESTKEEKEDYLGLYHIGRLSSLAALNKEEDLFSKDIITDILLGYKRSKENHAINYVKDNFKQLDDQIKRTKDPKELQKIKKQLAKKRVEVSKKVLKEFEKNKKRLLNKVQKKIDKSKKG